MKIIIVGCGKLGSSLALFLEKQNHDITVITSEESQFKRLGSAFKGRKILGLGIDKATLESANIQRVDCVIACTESDETNAVVGRMARAFYKVPKVIARLFDREKVSIYNTLGIQVIATTNWALARTQEILTTSHLEPVLTIGNGPLDVVRVQVPELLIGKSVRDLSKLGEIQVNAVNRGNKAFIPVSGTTLEKGDILYITVMSDAMATLKHMLGL